MENKILVHVCCGVCAAHIVEQLKPKFAELKLYFYNPNIYPRKEYDLRLETARRLSKIYGVNLEEGPYEPAIWDAAVRGYEMEPERGKRCQICFRLRLKKTAALAQANGFNHFTTTLTMGRNKRSRDVMAVGEEAAASAGIQFLSIDFKKGGGIERTQALAKQYKFYRQTYCGCQYSLRPPA